MSPKEGKYAFSISVSLTIAFGIKSLQINVAHMSTRDLYAVMQWVGRGSAHGATVTFWVYLTQGFAPRALVPVPKLMPSFCLSQLGCDHVVCGSQMLRAEHRWVKVCLALLESESGALTWSGRA